MSQIDPPRMHTDEELGELFEAAHADGLGDEALARLSARLGPLLDAPVGSSSGPADAGPAGPEVGAGSGLGGAAQVPILKAVLWGSVAAVSLGLVGFGAWMGATGKLNPPTPEEAAAVPAPNHGTAGPEGAPTSEVRPGAEHAAASAEPTLSDPSNGSRGAAPTVDDHAQAAAEAARGATEGIEGPTGRAGASIRAREMALREGGNGAARRAAKHGPIKRPTRRRAAVTRETTGASGDPSVHRPAHTGQTDGPGVEAALKEDRLLQRAQRALPHDPRTALSLTVEHQREFPRGMLVQEREVVAIEALARLDRSGEARERAGRFLSRFPRSAQRVRVEALLERLAKP